MRWSTAVLALGLASCADSTPVGFVECIGAKAQCELPELGEYYDFELEPISSTDLESLEPTWTRRSEPTRPLTAIAPGPNGELWGFSADDDHVEVSTFDRERGDRRTRDPRSASWL